MNRHDCSYCRYSKFSAIIIVTRSGDLVSSLVLLIQHCIQPINSVYADREKIEWQRQLSQEEKNYYEVTSQKT